MRTSLVEPPRLVVGRFDPSVEAAELPNLHLLEITKPLVMPEGMENLIIENTDYEYNSKEAVSKYLKHVAKNSRYRLYNLQC